MHISVPLMLKSTPWKQSPQTLLSMGAEAPDSDAQAREISEHLHLTEVGAEV